VSIINNDARESPTLASRSAITSAPILLCEPGYSFWRREAIRFRSAPAGSSVTPGFILPMVLARAAAALAQALAVDQLGNPDPRGPRKTETRWHHTHDSVLSLIQLDRLAGDVRISGEPALPQAVA
jgi:hypothetical protein